MSKKVPANVLCKERMCIIRATVTHDDTWTCYNKNIKNKSETKIIESKVKVLPKMEVKQEIDDFFIEESKVEIEDHFIENVWNNQLDNQISNVIKKEVVSIKHEKYADSSFEHSQQTRINSAINQIVDGVNIKCDLDTIEVFKQSNIDSKSNICNTSCNQLLTTKKKNIRREHNCVFCNVKVVNFVGHIEKFHSNETQVQEISSLDKRSKKRKNLISKIRREGDFVLSKIIPVMNVQNNINDCIVCKFCRGYYAPNSLRTHTKKCFFNPDPSQRLRSQTDGQTIMAGQFTPNDPLVVRGLLKMLSADDISFIAKKDPLICEVARIYLKTHKEKRMMAVAKRQVRLLARILKKSREILRRTNLDLIQLLHPDKFQTLIKATKVIANYDIKTRTYGSPAVALQMGTIIKKAINAAMSLRQEDCREDVDKFKALMELMETDWAKEVSNEAGQHSKGNRFSTPSLISAVQDVKKVDDYLRNNIKEDLPILIKNPFNEALYRNVMDCIFCSIVLFNKRRIGDLQRLTLALYTEDVDTIPSTRFENVLSDTEKIFYFKLRRIIIRDKRESEAPVLFENNITQAIDTLIKLRGNFELKKNEYLFGVPRSEKPITGYSVMREKVLLALGCEEKASFFTSTKMRKHLGTIAQIFQMKKDDLDQLWAFMGYTEKPDSEWYRLPKNIYQTAKVSRLLMVSKNQKVFERYDCTSFDEIEYEDYLVVDNKAVESDNVMIKKRVVTRRRVINKNKGIPKRTLTPWSDEQKGATEVFFEEHIKRKIPPKKDEVMELISQHPDLFVNRKWPVIKVYICNKFKKK